jgi:hypothetical protein
MHPARTTALFAALGLVALAPLACSKEGSSAAPAPDPCLFSACGEDAGAPAKPDASAPDAGRVDAAFAGDVSTGTGVVEWDGFVPPPSDSGGGSVVPIRDAEWDPDGVSGPTGPIAPGALPEATPCGAGPVAFATHELQVVTQGPAAMPAAFASQWQAAVARAGAPGPAIVLFADSGAVDGGRRRFRFGAPSPASSGAFAFASQGGNPLASTWSFTPAAYVEAAHAAAAPASPALLRFRTAAGSTVDVPITDAALQGSIRGASGDAGACSSLGNTGVWLVLPAAAGEIVIEGQTLRATLGDPAPQQPTGVVGWTVRLFGTLPKIAFAGGVP